ncbi:MAG: hypothetical protein K6E33_04480 [Lachnospiraceae bacterium]|nr:hypothetical protein [Lachnospiraceae bacterium]
MTGIIRTSIDIFREFGGGYGRWILYFAALIYLLYALRGNEDENEMYREKRIIFIWTPLVITLLFFLPPFYILYSKVTDISTYYRILWLLPSEVTVCQAAVCLVEKAGKPVIKAAVAIAACALIILTGKYTYDSDIASRAENPYHLPQYVMDICDEIAPADGRYEVCAVFPPELVYYVRQYRTDIRLVYGREMVEPAWAGEGYNGVYNEMAAPVINMDSLLREARASERGPVKYYILGNEREIDRDPREAGLIPQAEIGGYTVYRDPEAEAGTEF